ncbi:MAG: tRNA-binding protein [Candidatus Bathyarchaeia archaeon]
MTGEVSIEEFKKLDIRVCRVISAERIPGRSKILKAIVDVGGEQRTVVVGGADIYGPDYFKDKLFILLANLQPKEIAGVVSKGMLLAADVGGKPIWLTVDGPAPPGSKVT